jgi:hypothetical protein
MTAPAPTRDSVDTLYRATVQAAMDVMRELMTATISELANRLVPGVDPDAVEFTCGAFVRGHALLSIINTARHELDILIGVTSVAASVEAADALAASLDAHNAKFWERQTNGSV